MGCRGPAGSDWPLGIDPQPHPSLISLISAHCRLWNSDRLAETASLPRCQPAGPTAVMSALSPHRVPRDRAWSVVSARETHTFTRALSHSRPGKPHAGRRNEPPKAAWGWSCYCPVQLPAGGRRPALTVGIVAKCSGRDSGIGCFCYY